MYHPLCRPEADIQNNVYIFRTYWKYWSDWDTVVDIAGRSVDQILVAARDFPCNSDRPQGSPILLYNVYSVFIDGKADGAWC